MPRSGMSPGSTERLALEVDHVTKLYGDHTVVDDLSSPFSQVA